MDKLTLTRQFGIQIRDFPWEVSGRIWNGIISIHTDAQLSDVFVGIDLGVV